MEIKKAKWNSIGNGLYSCSSCGTINRDTWYCPSCGADMRGILGNPTETTVWDLFDKITTAYYGEHRYFLQKDDTVYSVLSQEDLMLDDAIDEFIKEISPTK